MARRTERLISWLGPDPPRVDVAHVTLGDGELSAHGSSTCAAHVLTYRVETGPRWITRALDVRIGGDGWWRTLQLHRSSAGVWSAWRADASRPPIELDVSGLDDALDCDLGLCPLTNSMPVLREGLIAASRRGERRRADLTMAWVSVPELDVTAQVQTYEAAAPTAAGNARIRFASEDFAEHIEVDDDGIVLDYPSIGTRLFW
ncbi:MAG TPA: putative glycolipid-binding domain-containing protein [Acidimicrobiales bacterium]|jgi:hypothetical protein|nr:putative glycolipid-binding domain-containing protein [Acidimicrobiales bacterium]